jgi:hypothetical protein
MAAYKDTDIDVVFEDDLIGIVIGPETSYFPMFQLRDAVNGNDRDIRVLFQNIATSLALDAVDLGDLNAIKAAVKAKTYKW